MLRWITEDTILQNYSDLSVYQLGKKQWSIKTNYALNAP